MDDAANGIAVDGRVVPGVGAGGGLGLDPSQPCDFRGANADIVAAMRYGRWDPTAQRTVFEWPVALADAAFAQAEAPRRELIYGAELMTRAEREDYRTALQKAKAAAAAAQAQRTTSHPGGRVAAAQPAIRSSRSRTAIAPIWVPDWLMLVSDMYGWAATSVSS